MQTAVVFLCMCLKTPDVDDTNKLQRALQYLKQTAFLPLIKTWDRTKNGKMFVAHSVYKTKGQCPKLNPIQNYTWDDSIPYLLWRLFIKALGWAVKDNLVEHDTSFPTPSKEWESIKYKTKKNSLTSDTSLLLTLSNAGL